MERRLRIRQAIVLAGAQLTETACSLPSAHPRSLTDGCLISYFSAVFGVLSVKSSMVNLPAGCSPMLTSRKTRGRCTLAIVAVVVRPKSTAASEDRWRLELSHAAAGFLPEAPTTELAPVSQHISKDQTSKTTSLHARPWYRSKMQTPAALRGCRGLRLASFADWLPPHISYLGSPRKQ